jgi:hypothetical protein
MNREKWEYQFERQLKQQLGIEPGQIRFQRMRCILIWGFCRRL